MNNTISSMWQRVHNKLLTPLFARDLWVTFAIDEIRKKYRGALLGLLWAPITTISFCYVLNIVYASAFGNFSENYFLYCYLGYSLWIYFAAVCSSACTRLIQAKGILLQHKTNKVVFSYLNVFKELLVFCINFVTVLFVLVAGSKAVPLLGAIYLVVSILLLTIWLFSLSILLSFVCVYVRDITHVVQSLLRFGFIATPVFWPEEILPLKFQFILDLNPMYHFITNVRQSVLLHDYDFLHLFVSLVVTTLTLLLAYITMTKLEDRLMGRL